MRYHRPGGFDPLSDHLKQKGGSGGFGGFGDAVGPLGAMLTGQKQDKELPGAPAGLVAGVAAAGIGILALGLAGGYFAAVRFAPEAPGMTVLAVVGGSAVGNMVLPGIGGLAGGFGGGYYMTGSLIPPLAITAAATVAEMAGIIVLGGVLLNRAT